VRPGGTGTLPTSSPSDTVSDPPPVSSSPAVELKGIEKRFLTQVAVHPLDLQVAPGEFITLLGPSGCGKTTLLRMVAGMEVPTKGRIFVFGEDVTNRPPNKRPLNLVFQRPTLFPHLTVAQNIAFGPKLKKTGKAEVAQKQEELLDLVELSGFGPRHVNELSGGQAQRVALARALANSPRVLLLDEPLSALDLAVRRQLQGKLKEIHRSLGTTFIYVTHDQEEAFSMSDRVAVMRAGCLQQLGTPREIYQHPVSGFVAKFLGLVNVLESVVVGTRSEEIELDASGLRMVSTRPAFATPKGARVNVVVRPDLITLRASDAAQDAGAVPASLNVVDGTVEDVKFGGSTVHYTVNSPQCTWEVSLQAGADRDLAVGTSVNLSWPEAACVVVPPD
jgi:spermidine/putrescine transport system ATP-binding protein